MPNVQFYANSHTREQALPSPSAPSPCIPLPRSWWYFYNCGTCQQTKSMSSSIFMVVGTVLILTKVHEKG